MQGPNYLDLAKTLAEGHYQDEDRHSAPKKTHPSKRQTTPRERVGHARIGLGERLAPSEVRLSVSTGPPASGI